MLNHIVAMGRLTRDPETKTIGNATMAQFTIACDRDYQKPDGERQTDFHICRAWRQLGEFVEKYFEKGSMIVVEGRLQTDSWNDADGSKRSMTYINIEKAHFGEKKKDKPFSTYDRGGFSRTDTVEIEDDGELPF